MPWPQPLQDKTAIDDSGSSAASHALTLDANVTAGSLVLVFAGFGTADQDPTCTDGTRTFVAPTGYKSWYAPDGQGQAVFYYENHPGGPTTITVNYPTSCAYRRLHVMEFPGVAASGAFDGLLTASGASSAADGTSSGNLTTSGDNDLVVGWTQNLSGGTAGTLAAGSGWSSMDSAGIQFMGEYRLQSTHGPIAATFSYSTVNTTLTTVIAFKQAAAAGVALSSSHQSKAVHTSNVSTVVGLSASFAAKATLSGWQAATPLEPILEAVSNTGPRGRQAISDTVTHNFVSKPDSKAFVYVISPGQSDATIASVTIDGSAVSVGQAVTSSGGGTDWPECKLWEILPTSMPAAGSRPVLITLGQNTWNWVGGVVEFSNMDGVAIEFAARKFASAATAATASGTSTSSAALILAFAHGGAGAITRDGSFTVADTFALTGGNGNVVVGYKVGPTPGGAVSATANGTVATGMFAFVASAKVKTSSGALQSGAALGSSFVSVSSHTAALSAVAGLSANIVSRAGLGGPIAVPVAVQLPHFEGASNTGPRPRQAQVDTFTHSFSGKSSAAAWAWVCTPGNSAAQIQQVTIKGGSPVGQAVVSSGGGTDWPELKMWKISPAEMPYQGSWPVEITLNQNTWNWVGGIIEFSNMSGLAMEFAVRKYASAATAISANGTSTSSAALILAFAHGAAGAVSLDGSFTVADGFALTGGNGNIQVGYKIGPDPAGPVTMSASGTVATGLFAYVAGATGISAGALGSSFGSKATLLGQLTPSGVTQVANFKAVTGLSGQVSPNYGASQSVISAIVGIVGHSLFKPFGSETLRVIEPGLGNTITIEDHLNPGGTLQWNWNHPGMATPHNGNTNTDLKTLIPAAAAAGTPYDVLVMTEAVPIQSNLDWSDSLLYAINWRNLALQYNANARTYYYIGWVGFYSAQWWPYISPQNDDGWRAWVDIDGAKQEALVQQVNSDLRSTGGQPLRIIPMHKVIGLFYDRMKAGQLSWCTSIHDIFHDDIHLNEIGYYLAALAHHCVIYRKKPVNPIKVMPQIVDVGPLTLTDTQLADLIDIAWTAVTAYPDSGVSANNTVLSGTFAAKASVSGSINAGSSSLGATFVAKTALVTAMAGNSMAAAFLAKSVFAGALAPGANVSANFIGDNLQGSSYFSGMTIFSNLWLSGSVTGTSNPWVSKGAGWNDGRNIDLDANGYPTSLLVDQQAVKFITINRAGSHTLLFDGAGSITIAGGGISGVSLVSAGRMTFNAAMTNNDNVDGTYAMISIDSTVVGNNIRNIRVFKSDLEATYQTTDFFDPIVVREMQKRVSVRFMDLQSTNDNDQVEWVDRKTPASFSQAGKNGVCLEYLIDFANKCNIIPYFCIPARASNDYITKMAQLIRDRLNPNLPLFIEPSNETWNPQFSQGAYFRDLYPDLVASLPDPTYTYQRQLSGYSRRAVEMFGIFRAQFPVNQQSRVRRILATQAGNNWCVTTILDFENAYQNCDYVSVGGYFGNNPGKEPANLALTQAQFAAILDAEIDATLENTQSTYSIVKAYGLKFIIYEGGIHLFPDSMPGTDAATGLLNKDIAAQKWADFVRSPYIIPLYVKLLNGFKTITENSIFMNYTFAGPYTKYGDWGWVESLDEFTTGTNKLAAFNQFVGTTGQALGSSYKSTSSLSAAVNISSLMAMPATTFSSKSALSSNLGGIGLTVISKSQFTANLASTVALSALWYSKSAFTSEMTTPGPMLSAQFITAAKLDGAIKEDGWALSFAATSRAAHNSTLTTGVELQSQFDSKADLSGRVSALVEVSADFESLCSHSSVLTAGKLLTFNVVRLKFDKRYRVKYGARHLLKRVS